MQPVAIFPDTESLLTSYLRTAFLADDLTVTTTVPTTRPEEFIRLFRTGGPRMNAVADRPQITIECWALNEERAYEIASQARAFLHQLPGSSYQGVAIYRLDEFSGPILDSDQELSDMPRYSWTFSLGVRGTAFTGI